MRDDLPVESETVRKIEMALGMVRGSCLQRIQTRAYGEVTFRFVWKDGELDTIRVVEETIVKEIPRSTT